MKKFLHVGCGSCRKDDTTKEFSNTYWQEIRLDSDPDAKPDLLASVTDLSCVEDESFDAIYSSHNLERLYYHEVQLVLKEFLRVLKRDGYLVLSVTDLQTVCSFISQDKLLETVFVSKTEPIAPIDLLFGHRKNIASGNYNSAHRTGFTQKTLIESLEQAGFADVMCVRWPQNFVLWTVASKSKLMKEELIELAKLHFPDEIWQMETTTKFSSSHQYINQSTENVSRDILPLVDLESEQVPDLIKSDYPVDTPLSYFSPIFWGTKDNEIFAEIIKVAAKMTDAFLFADNLFTFQRNLSMFRDKAFVSAWKENIAISNDEGIVWRRYILVTLAHHALKLEGDFVECGAWMGTAPKVIIDYFGRHRFRKKYWLYDLFEHKEDMKNHPMPGLGAELYDWVCKRFEGYDNVEVIKGKIPEILYEKAPEKICFLHLDLNWHEYEIAALEYLFDRIVTGGIIVMDDYEWFFYRLIKFAADEFFGLRGYRVIPLPTGQGIVIK